MACATAVASGLMELSPIARKRCLFGTALAPEELVFGHGDCCSSQLCSSMPESVSDTSSFYSEDSTFCRQTSTCSLKSYEDPYASAAGGPTLLSDEALFDDDCDNCDVRTCAPLAQARSNYHEADAEEQLLVQLQKETEAGPMSPPPILPEHRTILMQWIKQVCALRKLSPATMFLAGSLMDRFLRAGPEGSTPPSLLQLLALTCISLASKMEQQQASEELVSVARDEKGQFYQPQDVTRMENHVLNTLGFRLRTPNVYTFLRHFLNRIGFSPQSSQVIPPGQEVAFHNVAINLAELALLDAQLSSMSCSVVAVSALLVTETALKGAQAQYKTVELLRTVGPALDLTHLSVAVQRLYQLFKEADAHVNASC